MRIVHSILVSQPWLQKHNQIALVTKNVLRTPTCKYANTRNFMITHTDTLRLMCVFMSFNCIALFTVSHFEIHFPKAQKTELFH